MEIIEIKDYKETRFNTAVALGNFDGVHMGHQELISKMITVAKELELASAILLFENHTKTVLEGVGPKLISSQEQKLKILDELRIENIYKMTFDKEVMKLSPEDFVKNILVEQLNTKAVIIGFDYRFGHKASGDPEYLTILGEKYNFKVFIIDPIIINEEVVSSTRIRTLISNGCLKDAKNLLSRNYSIIGKVVPGKKIGNKLGFPTANLEIIDNYIIPKYGVYNTNTIIDGKKYKSATSVGLNPTFDEASLKIETHILNFNDDIYGKEIQLEFIEFIREEIKFDSLDELIIQIEKDIEEIRSR